MKIDYFTLLSRKSLYLNNVGHVISPTLASIEGITYPVYQQFLSILTITPQIYYTQINKDKTDWYNALPEKESGDMNIFDVIVSDIAIRNFVLLAYNYFFEEDVIWDDNENLFVLCNGYDENNQRVPTGVITRQLILEVNDVIKQRNGLGKKSEEQKPKFKNKIAEKIWIKTHNSESKGKNDEDKRLELGNLISALSSYSQNLNIINIWDMTVFQLYDQFQRLQSNTYFDIAKSSISVWGDKENKFDASQWYSNIYETKTF